MKKLRPSSRAIVDRGRYALELEGLDYQEVRRALLGYGIDQQTIARTALLGQV
jgi:hypothetical protein